MEIRDKITITIVAMISGATSTLLTYSIIMYSLSDEVEALKKKSCKDSIQNVITLKVDSINQQQNNIDITPIPPIYKPYVPSHNNSDDEIRMLREKQSFKGDGSYIYTPMRSVPTREKQIEKEVQKYIDKHGDRLYEELEAKYGN